MKFPLTGSCRLHVCTTEQQLYSMKELQIKMLIGVCSWQPLLSAMLGVKNKHCIANYVGKIVVLLKSYLCHLNSSMVSNYTLLQIRSELTLTEKGRH